MRSIGIAMRAADKQVEQFQRKRIEHISKHDFTALSGAIVVAGYISISTEPAGDPNPPSARVCRLRLDGSEGSCSRIARPKGEDVSGWIPE